MLRFKLVPRLASAVLVFAALSAPVFSSPASAQTPRVDARAEVAAALVAASATQAAELRNMDARLRQAHAEIERLQARGQGARAELIAAQEAYVADLAQRDRAYAQEIAVFRAAVTDIASTPEGAAALARFNAGDEIGALAVLDQIVDARERARQVRADIETAAERRRIAALALEARARGRLDTNAVIARYVEVTRLDPGVHWDWIELGRLYVDAGDLPEARRAAERAAATASDDRDRSVAVDALGDVLVAQGDLAGARARYEQSLAIDERLAARDPSSTLAQIDLSLNHQRIGDVLIAQGDLAGARMRYEQSLAIRQRSPPQTLVPLRPSATSRSAKGTSAICWSPRAISSARVLVMRRH
jgi:tetratricopeptide (TPR) repeat protein